MRKYFFIAMMVLFISCNQAELSKTITVVPASDTTVITADTVLPLHAAMIQFSEAPQKIMVPADQPSNIQGNKGLKITVDPNALETADGSPLGKEIQVELKEMNKQQDLFENNAATVSNGQLLVSGGAYYIGMSSDGKKLQLKAGKALSIEIPKITEKEMELFYGQRDSSGNMNWIPAGKKITVPAKTTVKITNPQPAVAPVAKTGSQNIVEAKTLLDLLADTTIKNGRMPATDFKQYVSTKTIPVESNTAALQTVELKDSISGKKIKKLEVVYYEPTEIQNLGWINCDRFYNAPNKVPVECEFDSSLISPSATIYVIFKNINSILSENIWAENRGGTIRLASQLPAGEPVNIIAITNQKGKLYSFKKSFIAGDGQALKLQFNPVEEKDLSKHLYNLK